MIDNRIKVGDIVSYRSVVDGPVTSTGHRVLNVCTRMGVAVAWVTGLRGCRAMASLEKETIK